MRDSFPHPERDRFLCGHRARLVSLAFMGPTAGKSTLLPYASQAVDRPTSARFRLHGVNVPGLNESDLADCGIKLRLRFPELHLKSRWLQLVLKNNQRPLLLTKLRPKDAALRVERRARLSD